MTALTIPEVADRLHLSCVTIYRWAGTGFLPSVKLGGRRLVLAEDLQRWLAEHKAAAPSP
jgi:excisionase family DNA binding protein